jgi:hypothetical protein
LEHRASKECRSTIGVAHAAHEPLDLLKHLPAYSPLDLRRLAGDYT